MNEDEIAYMRDSIGLYPMIAKEPVWLRAFAIYNEANRNNGQDSMLSVTCKICYTKVYMYIISLPK